MTFQLFSNELVTGVACLHSWYHRHKNDANQPVDDLACEVCVVSYLYVSCGTIAFYKDIYLSAPWRACAPIGLTLVALMLAGSSRNAANFTDTRDFGKTGEVKHLNAEAVRLFNSAEYSKARREFVSAATLAEASGDEYGTAMNWNNAGSCSIHTMQFGEAFSELRHAQSVAVRAHEFRPLLFTLNNLASLYIQLGQPDKAVLIGREALSGPAAHADADIRARLLCEMASALVALKRFDEAVPYNLDGINGLLEVLDLDGSARALGNLGNDCLSVGRNDEAEWALSEGLRLITIHRLNRSANILSGLARLRSRQGNVRAAALLFDSALAVPPGPTPKWRIYAERGQFRLDYGNLRGAVADFQEARRRVALMRADMVPADQDRVAFESGSDLSHVMQGLVDTGNRLALATGNRSYAEQSFAIEEQDRLWSLRALIPIPNDWRSRLTTNYWDLLAQYQALAQSAPTQTSRETENKRASLQTELQQLEVAAAGNSRNTEAIGSPVDLVKSILDNDSVLLSFHISKTSSWVWAVDRHRVDVYRLPPEERIRSEVTAFAWAVDGSESSTSLGTQMYKELFGSIPDTYLRHRHWLLELDGPLYELPLSALVSGGAGHGPIYLMQRAVLQTVPGVLLLKQHTIESPGEFLGIGDPVYNTADRRYTGKRGGNQYMLGRLEDTAAELEGCARAWNSSMPVLLTGRDARPAAVQTAIARNPMIIHFATHVTAGPGEVTSDVGEFQSGFIALSLDSSGRMGFLGPREVVAQHVTAELVVLNGCHSGQGQALPSTGLMGLTRAWIGAGASAVISTMFPVEDRPAAIFMSDYYWNLRRSPSLNAASALRETQLSAQRKGEPLRVWAAYSILSRIL